MMKKQKPVMGEPVYVSLDDNGQEIVKKKKSKPRIHLKKKPEDKYVAPTTERQKAALAAMHCERVNFADAKEYGVFRMCESRFKENGSLEDRVWGEWLDSLISWASKKNAMAPGSISIYNIASASENKERWGQFWHGNKRRVEREMKSPTKSIQASHKNEEAKW